jgi:hypothetical protein
MPKATPTTKNSLDGLSVAELRRHLAAMEREEESTYSKTPVTKPSTAGKVTKRKADESDDEDEEEEEDGVSDEEEIEEILPPKKAKGKGRAKEVVKKEKGKSRVKEMDPEEGIPVRLGSILSRASTNLPSLGRISVRGLYPALSRLSHSPRQGRLRLL